MSTETIDNLLESVSDLLPVLTRSQVEELQNYLDTHDYEAAQFLMMFWTKQYREGLDYNS